MLLLHSYLLDATLRLLRRVPRGGFVIDAPCAGPRGSSVDVRETCRLYGRLLAACGMEQRHFLADSSTVKPSQAIHRAMLVAPCQQRHTAAQSRQHRKNSKARGGYFAVGESRLARGTDGLDEDSGRHRQDGARHRRLDRGPPRKWPKMAPARHKERPARTARRRPASLAPSLGHLQEASGTYVLG